MRNARCFNFMIIHNAERLYDNYTYRHMCRVVYRCLCSWKNTPQFPVFMYNSVIKTITFN